MRYKRFGLFATVLALAVSVFGGVTIAPRAYAAGQTCVWTGTAGDNKFSTAGNWSSCGSSVPQTGDIVSFPYIAATSYVLDNDLPQSTLLGGVTNSSSTNQNYSDYTINRLALGDGAILTRTAGSSIAISDTITSTGALTIVNTTFQFVPTSRDIELTPTDLTYVNVPQACAGGFGEYSFSIKPTGQVNVGSGSWYDIEGTEAKVVVAASGGVGVGGAFAGDITFNGGGTTQGPGNCGEANSFSLQASTATLSGTITLGGGDIVYNIYDGATLTITGTIEGGSSKLVAYSNSAGTFVNNASVNNSATSGGSQTVAMHKVADVTDSQPDALLSVGSNEILTFDGIRDNVFVASKAILKGTGTALGQLYVSENATVAPGHSPGCLTSDTLSLYGVYEFELGGSKPCTGYDQLKVVNADDSSTAVSFGTTSTATLSTSRYKGYTPEQGQVFVIIKLSGDKAVEGTFKDLPEGATFKQNGIVFKISYKGGDGNDVTLTVMNAPTAPDTGFKILLAHPLALFGAVTMLAVGLVVWARKRLVKQ